MQAQKSAEKPCGASNSVGVAIIGKKCSRCKENKTEAYFHRNKSRADGLSTECKPCVLARAKARYLADPKKSIEKCKKWQRENAEHMRKYSAEYRSATKDRRSAVFKAWREKNALKRADDIRKWKAENVEHKRQYEREYFKQNPGPIRARNADRRAKTKGCAGGVSAAWIEHLLVLQKKQCAVCTKSIPDSYHVDHIFPLSKGGVHVKSNIQLLCKRCNLTKSAKHPIDFMQSKGFLL